MRGDTQFGTPQTENIHVVNFGDTIPREVILAEGESPDKYLSQADTGKKTEQSKVIES